MRGAIPLDIFLNDLLTSLKKGAATRQSVTSVYLRQCWAWPRVIFVVGLSFEQRNHDDKRCLSITIVSSLSSKHRHNPIGVGREVLGV